MIEFLDGAAFSAFLTVALWFAGAWWRSRDRLLGAFGIAFALFAVNRLLVATADSKAEADPAVYLIRAAGFVVIIMAIVDRNRRRRTP